LPNRGNCKLEKQKIHARLNSRILLAKMSGFYLASSSTSPTSTPAQHLDSDASSEDDLPYPQPLQRDAFLQRDFAASAYLSDYIQRNRQQTLGDLRGELRARSVALQQELLDLVNAEYRAFLTLGGDLRGGGERVEGVRVGVLGFVSGVGAVRDAVRARRAEVERLVAEKERLAREKDVARRLVEVHTRTGELEEALQDTAASEDEDGDGDDSTQEELTTEQSVGAVSLRRLKRLVRGYVVLKQMMESIGLDHPFVMKQEERVVRIRNTLLLDLGASLRQARAAGTAGHDRLLRLVILYAEMGEEREGLKVVRDSSISWASRQHD